MRAPSYSCRLPRLSSREDTSEGPPRFDPPYTNRCRAGPYACRLSGRLHPREWDSDEMGRTLYGDAAVADGTGPDLRVGVSLLVDEDRVVWIRCSDDEPDPGPNVDTV